MDEPPKLLEAERRCRCLPCCGALSIWVENGEQKKCVHAAKAATWDRLT